MIKEMGKRLGFMIMLFLGVTVALPLYAIIGMIALLISPFWYIITGKNLMDNFNH